MKRISDREILKKIKKKDESTILYLRREYLPMVKYMILNYRYSDGIRTITATQNDADDLLHDALYVLIKKIIGENFELTSKLSTYFYAVSKNLLKVKLRKKLLEMNYKDYNEDHKYSPDRTDILYDKNLQKNAFEYYFQSLSEVCKEILNLYWLEFSVAEISSKLGNTKNYIMKRKYECQNRLIKLIQKNPDNI